MLSYCTTENDCWSLSISHAPSKQEYLPSPLLLLSISVAVLAEPPSRVECAVYFTCREGIRDDTTATAASFMTRAQHRAERLAGSGD